MAEAGFEIEGRVYPIPEIGTFDMDEAQVLWDYAELALEDFALADPDASEEEQSAHEKALERKIRNPAFKRSLLVVAYHRGNPTVPLAKVKELMGRVNMVAALEAFVDEEEGEASPPAESESTRLQSASSSNGSDDSSTSSGLDSTTTSDEPVLLLAPTGAGS